MICALLFFREGLSEARSPYLISPYLQQSGLVLLLLCAAASLVLHRMAIQMDGGKLAIALRFLTLYTLVRGVFVLLQAWRRMAIPELPPMQPWFLQYIQYFLEIGWQSVPWIAALAAGYRAELTVHAAKELEHQRAARAALASA